jgi:hypothetical protein
VTNTLAYYSVLQIRLVKSFLLEPRGVNVITLFHFNTDGSGNKLDRFFSKPIQPSLVFAGEAGAFPSFAPLSCQILDKVEKAWEEKNALAYFEISPVTIFFRN